MAEVEQQCPSEKLTGESRHLLTAYVVSIFEVDLILCGSACMAPSRGPAPLARNLHAVLDSHKGGVNIARYSKGTAKYILTGGQDRTIRLWNAHQGTEIKTFAAHGYEILSITVYVYFTILLGVVLTISKIAG